MVVTEWLRERFSHDDFWSHSQLLCTWGEECQKVYGNVIADDALQLGLTELLEAGELGKCDDVYYRTEKFLDPNQAYYNLSDAGFLLLQGQDNEHS